MWLRLGGKWKDKFVEIDQEDYALVWEYNWLIASQNGHVYRSYWRDGKKQRMRLDSMLIPHGRGFNVIHKDKNPLNCTRENLELVQYSTLSNSRKWVGRSGLRGVSLVKNRWKVCIRINGKLYHLGSFINPYQAALAYNAKALEVWGEHCFLNDVDDLETKMNIFELYKPDDPKRQDNGFKFNKYMHELARKAKRKMIAENKDK